MTNNVQNLKVNNCKIIESTNRNEFLELPKLQNHFKIFVKQSHRVPRHELEIFRPLIVRLEHSPIFAVLLNACSVHELSVLLHQIRQHHLDDCVENLLSNHDDGELNKKFHQATAWRAFLLSQPEDSVVLVRGSNPFAFQECDVKERRVVIDKLEQINLQRQAVVIFGLSSSELHVRQKHCQVIVQVIQNCDDDQVDDCSCDREHDEIFVRLMVDVVVELF